MSTKSPRDRHGRGIRHSLTGSAYRTGSSSQDQFRSIVDATVEYLRDKWPTELEKLNYLILDAPIIGEKSTSVRRWAIRKEQMTIVLYRLPITRLDAPTTQGDDRVRIEHRVFEAAAALIDKEPWELIFGDETDL